MTGKDKIWQSEALSQTFLEGVRGAIPLASEQIAVMLRLVAKAQPKLDRFLDLGCGDGILGRSILAEYPLTSGVFMDFSQPMLAAAKSKLGEFYNRVQFIQADFSESEWSAAVADAAPFSAIVSGFAIHHQPDERKRDIYAKIYQLLSPGGIFLNLEHVSSASAWIEGVHDELFIDSLYAFHQEKVEEKVEKTSREDIARDYYYRPDKAANILAPVEVQCDWLRSLGFVEVDCYFKLFEIALFGGMVATDGLPDAQCLIPRYVCRQSL